MFRIVYRFLASLALLAVRSGHSKDLEIIVLRHENAVLRRKVHRPAINDDDRTLLGAVAAALPKRLRQGWIVTPETLLRWHRKRIARHWTQPPVCPMGRPRTPVDLRQLIVRLATENPTWGHRRIHGELATLGHTIATTTVWQILTDNGIGPSPNRSDVTWTEFLQPQAALASDFFTIDTALLRRYYILFFINVNTREVFFAAVTVNPTGEWTTQAARNLINGHGQRLEGARALVRDRGSQFIEAFDEIFRTEGLKILKTPVRTPVANTFAERWIGSIRRELLKQPEGLPRTHHLEPTPAGTTRRRLHQALQQPPTPPVPRPTTTTRDQGTASCAPTPPSGREIKPLPRPHQRIPKRSLTSHDTISGHHRP